MILGKAAIKLMVASCAIPGTPIDYMEALVQQESNGYVYALGLPKSGKKSLYPETDEGAKEAKKLAAYRFENNLGIDVGLGQINSWNIKKYNLKVDDLFEPCYNVEIASTIFVNAVKTSCGSLNGTTTLCLDGALRLYNTGKKHQTISGNDYVAKIYKRMYGSAFSNGGNKFIEIEGTDLIIDSESAFSKHEEGLLFIQ